MSSTEFRIANLGFRIDGTVNCGANRNSQFAIQNSARGFTLLEIIIVILILSVLTAAAVHMLRNTVRREREADLRLAIRQLSQPIDRYKLYNDQSHDTASVIEGKTPTGDPKE